MKAPMPYFGGKARVADRVWSLLGDVPNYVEPFAGSLAVLLARPNDHEWWDRVESVNDADGDLYDRELYPDWQRFERKALADGALARTEVLWMNPSCAAAQAQGAMQL